MIEYRGVFRFDTDRATLWKAVSSIDSFPHWAPWLHDLEVDGPWPEAGTSVQFAVVSPLPIRLHISVELTEVRPLEVLKARVHQDIEGTGRMSARDVGRGTEVELTWEIAPRTRVFQTLFRFSGPFVRWTQDWAVRAAVAGVKRKLREAPPSPSIDR